jgi:fructose-1,6-bisphosphatase II
VVEAAERPLAARPGEGFTCLCESFARATEAAALAGARWLGRADEAAAHEAASSGMSQRLNELPIDGRIVIGSADDERLVAGSRLGAGGGEVDLALDPLEAASVVARGGSGAMSMVAVGAPGSMVNVPDMYMRKMAVGPTARGSIDLGRPAHENVELIASAFGRRVGDITTIILDRPRHQDLIEEIRAAGARIKLIPDGDVTASISAAVRGTNDHLSIGIGGSRQAVLAAAALRCLGGELQAQFWPTTRSQIDEARQLGFDDMSRIFTNDDLVSGEVIFVATGVSNGDLLRGVRFLADSARTHSLVMCTYCNWVRFVDSTHFFARERREEVRLPGM